MTRAQCARVPAHGSESGMTLVEVVISVVLLSMITGAVAAAFITGFNGVRPSQQRVRESNDAQVIASFLVRDAQSAGGSNPNTGTGDASLGVSSPGSAPDCTGPSGTVVMRFAWREYTASATSKLWVANYFFDASAQHDRAPDVRRRRVRPRKRSSPASSRRSTTATATTTGRRASQPMDPKRRARLHPRRPFPIGFGFASRKPTRRTRPPRTATR